MERSFVFRCHLANVDANDCDSVPEPETPSPFSPGVVWQVARLAGRISLHGWPNSVAENEGSRIPMAASAVQPDAVAVKNSYGQVTVSRRNEPLVHPVPSVGRWVKYT